MTAERIGVVTGRFALVAIVAAALCGCLFGCADDQDDLVEGTGTVTWFSFETGFYGIVSEDGEHYAPIDLPEEFREGGLRVRFTARIRDDLMSFHGWGTLVELLDVEKL